MTLGVDVPPTLSSNPTSSTPQSASKFVSCANSDRNGTKGLSISQKIVSKFPVNIELLSGPDVRIIGRFSNNNDNRLAPERKESKKSSGRMNTDSNGTPDPAQDS